MTTSWDLFLGTDSTPGYSLDPIGDANDAINATLDSQYGVWGAEGTRRQFICPSGDRIWQQVINGEWTNVTNCPGVGSVTYNKREGESPTATDLCGYGLKSEYDYTLQRNVCRKIYETRGIDDPLPPEEPYGLPGEELLNFIKKYGVYIVGIVILFLILILMRK